MLPMLPSTPLYHYTTQDGLLGILKGNCIWATNINYLNDSSDYQLACDLAKEVLDEKRRQVGRDERKLKKIQHVLHSISTAETLPLHICVSCFSENGDSLSQWRAYGGVAGYSVGFRPAYLRQIG
jgi:hypothetical protein